MNSDGRLGDEDALGAIADCSFVKEDGGVAATASEAGDKMFVFSWANFSCVSVICSCAAKFSFRKSFKRIRFSTEAEGSSVCEDLGFFAVFLLGMVSVFCGSQKVVDFLR